MSRILSLSIIFISCFLASMTSCIEDGVSQSSADQPTFSTDTLHMGTIFTEQVSTTARLTVYNRASKGISISRIAMSGENAECFRLNVDGFSGESFSDVEIRANDSIFVLVSTTLPANGAITPERIVADLHFLTNGVDRKVAIAADGWDATRLHGLTVDRDTILRAGRPYVVFDSIAVRPGATLTIEAGAKLFFHQGAHMRVDGTLLSLGTPGNEVTLAGDRTGNVAADISFDLMSRQWEGILFGPTSGDSRMEHTLVANTVWGVQVDGSEGPEGHMPQLTLVNSRLRNSGGNGLALFHSRLLAYGTEIAEAAGAVLLLHGGDHVVNHCTLSNYYLFAAPSAPILTFAHTSASDPGQYDEDAARPYTRAEITNSIIYGMNADLSHGMLDGTEIYLRNCLLKSDGSDDDHFADCVWNTDPLFFTVRNDYLFDYRLQPESPAIGAGNPSLTLPESAVDRLGTPRNPAAPSLGAYEYAETR